MYFQQTQHMSSILWSDIRIAAGLIHIADHEFIGTDIILVFGHAST